MEPGHIVSCYREFAPSDALKHHVRAFFSFIPPSARTVINRRMTSEVVFRAGQSFCSPMFADGHSSVVFDLGMACHVDGVWRPDLFRGRLIGAITRVDPVCDVTRPAMVGAYFHGGQIPSIAHVPAIELTDKVVPLEDLWDGSGSELASELSGMNEGQRIDRLEALLLHRIGHSVATNSLINMPRLVTFALEHAGKIGVEDLADSAGISRQHLARLFRECVGVSPKLYCRLARFQSGLYYATVGRSVDWAEAALETGYADQSHMIAEFREFSSLTPHQLTRERWFHPFIERTRITRRRMKVG
jgi:AraC-like DNA-binding protein